MDFGKFPTNDNMLTSCLFFLFACANHVLPLSCLCGVFVQITHSCDHLSVSRYQTSRTGKTT